MKTILILGGYGNFGKRIVESLSTLPNITLYISGRDIVKAELLREKLKNQSLANLKTLMIDINSDEFETILNDLSPDIVIHTCGPFQGQDYHVPLACIDAGAHYIDLADDRRFVCDIKNLDEKAKDKNLLIVSGASSVPGLSSTVIDFYKADFSTIDSIDIAIAPGNKAERGEATVKGILSYTGQSFNVFSNGLWGMAYGWMEPRLKDFQGIIGKRWLANVDVPDLELFPGRYSVKNTVKFQAGLELPILHLTMVGMAYIARVRIVKNWAPLTKLIVKVSHLFNLFGTDVGGMNIQIDGRNHNNEKKSVKWTLYADKGIGPYIPTISAVIIAKKILSGNYTRFGATPCLGLYDLTEFKPYAEKLNICFEEYVIG